MKQHLYSNEIVFRGHPDKVCDQISGALLTWLIRDDPKTRAGIEVLGGKGLIVITGEVTTKAAFNDAIVKALTRKVLKSVGYDADKYEIINNIGVQSPDIAQGVDTGGAGDQGMMFGYACDDTPEMLPTAMVILQRFARVYDELRSQYPKLLFADGKAQITGVYEGRKLVRIKTFLCSYQNAETRRNYTDTLLKLAILEICKDYNIEIDEFLFNPTGKFLIGGFEGDAGLTGRKIVVDAYQSFANVGGGCMNGKDPTKVDFSAAHKARQIAKMVLKSNPQLEWCEVQLSYAIGKPEPLAIYIETDAGNMEVSPTLYEECTPKRIIRDLRLKELDFEELARFGHFTHQKS